MDNHNGAGREAVSSSPGRPGRKLSRLPDTLAGPKREYLERLRSLYARTGEVSGGETLKGTAQALTALANSTGIDRARVSEPDLSKMLSGKKPARPEVIRALHRLADPHTDPAELETQAKQTIRLFYGYLRQDNPELHRMYRLQDDNRRLQEEIDRLHTHTQTLERALQERRQDHARVEEELHALRAEQVRTAADRTQLTDLAVERDAALERIAELQESLRHAERAAVRYRQDLEHGRRLAEQAEQENTDTSAPGGPLDVQALVEESFALVQRGTPQQSDELLLSQAAHRPPSEIHQLYQLLEKQRRRRVATDLLHAYSAQRNAADILRLLLEFHAIRRGDPTAKTLLEEVSSLNHYVDNRSDTRTLLRAIVEETPEPELSILVRPLAEVAVEPVVTALAEEAISAQRLDVLQVVLRVSAAAHDSLTTRILGHLERTTEDSDARKMMAQAGVRWQRAGEGKELVLGPPKGRKPLKPLKRYF
ncbi:hypothetical protein [Streptomyces sp. NPDC057696]|uniref:hypothetical protein n=1 Tax=Streptomyces sp. NPDC057696 TaxID=3346218 RepID=UPI0036A82853